MISKRSRAVTAIVSLVLVVAVAAGCDSVKGVGNSTGDKIKQGGDAGGSTGYP